MAEKSAAQGKTPMAKKKYIVMTNNPLVKALEPRMGAGDVCFMNVSHEEILKKVRDRVHRGARLLSHPLAGSVKPNENPYRSVMISCDTGIIDMASLEIIERAIETFRKFEKKPVPADEAILEDFRLIDKTLIEGALASADSLS